MSPASDLEPALLHSASYGQPVRVILFLSYLEVNVEVHQWRDVTIASIPGHPAELRAEVCCPPAQTFAIRPLGPGSAEIARFDQSLAPYYYGNAKARR